MKCVRGLAVLSALILPLTGCGGGDDESMPDVSGKRLDVALPDIERAGFSDEPEVVGGGVFGVIDESNWVVCDQEPAAGEAFGDKPRLTVDRSCHGDEASPPPSEEPTPSESPSETATPTETASPAASDYAYRGPKYDVVAVDENQGPAHLTAYWVHTDPFDYADDAYKDQAKLLIADVARQEGSDKVTVNVVTDKEVIAAEAVSTSEDFLDERGANYVYKRVLPREETAWVASYTGGIDYDSGKPSDAESAFEIVWRPYATSEIEKWRPEVAP